MTVDSNKETGLVKVDLVDNMKGKNLVEKTKFLEISHKITYEFYAKLLQDYHATEFFQSYYTIEEIARKQSEVLYMILDNIQ